MAIYQRDRLDVALGRHLTPLLIFLALLNSHCSSVKIAKTSAQVPHKSSAQSVGTLSFGTLARPSNRASRRP